MWTGPHQVLAATLTLSQPGGGRLDSSPQIFRPSYGPELGVGSKAIITIIMRPKIIDNTLLSVCYCCLLELDILFEQKLVRIRLIPEKKLHI